MRVSLGQLFLLRRELKQEMGQLESGLGSLYAYREDKAIPDEDFNVLFSSLMRKKNLLYSYDVAVNSANSQPNTVVFNNVSLSLSEARIKKMHMVNDLNCLTNHARMASHYQNKVESEPIWDTSVTPPVMRPQKYSYIMVASVTSLKQDAAKLTKQISQLDALIQKADWTLEIEIPEVENS